MAVANLSTLSETVDQSTMDRKLADEIQKRLDQIREDIKTKGFSRVKVDSKVFRINTVDDITGKK